ncbi:hypothetical protein ACQEU8_19930 [Streptomyces sp. CA-250714]
MARKAAEASARCRTHGPSAGVDDKLAVRYEATVLVAAINEWL